MSHVFISYNQEDADFAAIVMMTLEKAGFDTWIDKNRLRPGADWSDEIDRGILGAFAMVLIMSPDSKASEYVTYEWSFALGAGVPVVPILRRDTDVHPRLRRLQYLDFRGNVRPWDDLTRELNSIMSVQATRWTPPRDTPAHLQRTILDLDSGNKADRRGAIEVLAESDHKIAREALRHALTHPFRDVRARAAIELAKLNDEIMSSNTAISALKDALAYSSNDQNDDTVWRAREAIVHLGHLAFNMLAETSKSFKDPARHAALDILGEVGGEDAIPILLEHTKDLDREIIKSAVQQLGDLRARQAVDILVRGVLEQPFPNEIDEDSFNWDVGWESVAVWALLRIRDKAIIPRFIEATKHPNPRVRMSAAYILGKLGDSSVIAVLVELFNDTVRDYFVFVHEDGRGWGRDSFAVHEMAAMALDDIGTPDAVYHLRTYRDKYPYKKDALSLSIDAE